MNKNTTKNLLLYAVVISIISFSNVSSLEVSSYVDPVTGYNSESTYDVIQANGFSLDLMNNNVIDQEDTLIVKDNEPLEYNPLAKLQDILDKTDSSIREIDIAINKINNGSKLKKFFIGRNLGILSFQLVQIKNQTYLLDHLNEEMKDKETIDESIKTKIDSQIKYLEQEKTMVEKFILEQKDKFSLLGWFIVWL